MKLDSISLSEWRQFRDVEIKLHPRLTIITGPNGSGKSTLLNLLTKSFRDSESESFLATPVSDQKTGRTGFSLSTIFKRFNPFRTRPDPASTPHHSIGNITFSDGQSSRLLVFETSSLQYDVSLESETHIPGFKIGSHRALPRYQEVKSIPISGISAAAALEYFTQAQAHYQRGDHYHREGRFIQNPVAPLKETLISFAALGEDNSHMKARPELVGLFDAFQSLLRAVLPAEVGFSKLEVRGAEIILISRSGEFPLDAASGGLMSIIQITWQIFLYVKARGQDQLALIDEPENHLHPSLQRDFLLNLVDAFPNIQFIVVTHSPFIISSVKDSWIFALRFNSTLEGSRSVSAVSAQRVDFSVKANTAVKILDDVLGVPVTLPIWVEQDLKRIAEEFERSNLDERAVQNLRKNLNDAGLSEFFPEALGKIVYD